MLNLFFKTADYENYSLMDNANPGYPYWSHTPERGVCLRQGGEQGTEYPDVGSAFSVQ